MTLCGWQDVKIQWLTLWEHASFFTCYSLTRHDSTESSFKENKQIKCERKHQSQKENLQEVHTYVYTHISHIKKCHQTKAESGQFNFSQSRRVSEDSEQWPASTLTHTLPIIDLKEEKTHGGTASHKTTSLWAPWMSFLSRFIWLHNSVWITECTRNTITTNLSTQRRQLTIWWWRRTLHTIPGGIFPISYFAWTTCNKFFKYFFILFYFIQLTAGTANSVRVVSSKSSHAVNFQTLTSAIQTGSFMHRVLA